MNRSPRFAILFALVAGAAPALAGNLDAPGIPTSGSGMPSTSDIYNRLDSGAAIVVPGAFQEPASGPASSGRTLAEIRAKLPVPDNVNGATASEVAAGKTFWGLRTDGTWGLTSGAMAAGANVTGPNGALSLPIPDGLYSGGRTATAVDANLVAGNIRSGATIFGVSGTFNAVGTSHVARSLCATGWGGANCDVCAGQWSGANCDVCPSGWSGVNCDIIAKPFPASMPNYAGTPWKCVLDSNTGLTWEVKTTDGGLHDQSNTYTWYDSGADVLYHGGATPGTCIGYSSCDTARYVAAVNAEQLCGYTDWRMPSISELQGLVVTGPYPTIDTAYFPNTHWGPYWSGSSSAPPSYFAWVVNFYDASTDAMAKANFAEFVRLVRDGQ